MGLTAAGKCGGADGERRRKRRREAAEEAVAGSSNAGLIRCADLVLPWLTPSELADVFLTCKSLNSAAAAISGSRSSDASRGFERVPIPFVNSVDRRPYAYFLYAPSQILNSFDRQPWGASSPRRANPGSVTAVSAGGDASVGCHCEGCGEDSSCPCLSMEGLQGMASECGSSCGCGPDCGNRATQSGVSVKLKIARVSGKGWGLFSDQLIKEGRFICEYAGELITTKEARKRQQEYDKLSSSTGNFSSALLVVREHLPSGKACLRINIDATKVGNVARFINHSCDGGNLSTVLVRSTGALLPRLCFFSSRDIAQDEELSFSYGEPRLTPDSEARPCFCGALSCFGTLPSELT